MKPAHRYLLFASGMAMFIGCQSPVALQPLPATAPPLSIPSRLPPVSATIVELPPVTPSEIRLVTETQPVPPIVRPATPVTQPEAVGPFPSAFPVPAVAQPMRLSMLAAIETGLDQNPDLIAVRRAEGVSLGAMGVAATYPFNPFVQVQATPLQNNPVGGQGTVYHYVLLMQNLQLAHQQRYREQTAAAALNSVRWNIHQAELLNLSQTERLFLTALYQRGLRDLARANLTVNQQLLAVLQRQHELGDIAAADVAIVRLDTQAAAERARLADATYETAVLDLRRQLNLPMTTSFEPAGDLLATEWLPATSENLADLRMPLVDCPMPAGTDGIISLAATRPDVMAARADVDTARANLDLARASRVPDLQAGPYYQRDQMGISFFGFRAQMDAPVNNNGMPLVRQRDAELIQRMTIWQQLQARAELEGQAAVDRYERARRLAAESTGASKESLPLELERLEKQYRAGEVDVIRIVTARNSLLALKRAQLDTLNEAAQAAVAVTAATGLPPQAIVVLP